MRRLAVPAYQNIVRVSFRFEHLRIPLATNLLLQKVLASFTKARIMFAVVWPKDFPRETFKRRSRPKHFTRIEFEVARKLRHRVSPVNINYLSKHCVKRRARYFKFGAFQHRKPNARVLLSLHRLSHEVCSLINDRSSVLPYASLGLRSLTHSLAIVKSGKRETGNVSRRGGQNLLV